MVPNNCVSQECCLQKPCWSVQIILVELTCSEMEDTVVCSNILQQIQVNEMGP